MVKTPSLSLAEEAALKVSVLEMRAQGMTQRDIADATGFNFGVIQKLTAGTRKGDAAEPGPGMPPLPDVAESRAELLAGHQQTLNSLLVQFAWAEAEAEPEVRAELMTKFARQITLIRTEIANLTGAHAPKKAETNLTQTHEATLLGFV